jgi:hypothetical protein
MHDARRLELILELIREAFRPELNWARSEQAAWDASGRPAPAEPALVGGIWRL